jgi:dephospho-CoA kinase
MKKYPKLDLVIVMVGKIASGKSTISKILAEKLKISYLSIGEFFREELRKRKVQASRQNLQKLGKELFLKYGVERILGEILKKVKIVNNACIIDGIRYPEAIKILKDIYESKCITIFLDYPATTRKRRYLKEKRIGTKEWKLIDNAFTESHILAIKDSADLIISQKGSPKKIADSIERYILTSEKIKR